MTDQAVETVAGSVDQGAVAAIVPVIDERDAIGPLVHGLRALGLCCVFVVDGGSADGTPALAAAAGAIVIEEPRRGYGRACLTGAERALQRVPHGHDAVAFLDGDGSCDPADLPALVDALASADVVFGCRSPDRVESGAMPWHARLGNVLVALVLSIRTGRRIHDLPPTKVIRAATLERIALDEAGFGWTVQFVARSLADPTIRIREVPAAFRRRRGGVSKVSGSVRASTHAAAAMLRVAIQGTAARPVIAMMAKAPRAGHAKTRLAIDLGANPTSELWAACLRDTSAHLLEAATDADMDPVLMLAERSDTEPVLALVGHRWSPHVQGRPGLSGALVDVFLSADDRGADRAVVVAGDVPSLPPAYAVEALDRLAGRRNAAVLGPSHDGGYHLVALRWPASPRWWPRTVRRRRRDRLAARLESAFAGPMGGASALDGTRRGLEAAGWASHDLAPWADLDTINDLYALANELQHDREFAPHTAAWLASRSELGDRVVRTRLGTRPDPDHGFAAVGSGPQRMNRPSSAITGRTPVERSARTSSWIRAIAGVGAQAFRSSRTKASGGGPPPTTRRPTDARPASGATEPSSAARSAPSGTRRASARSASIAAGDERNAGSPASNGGMEP